MNTTKHTPEFDPETSPMNPQMADMAAERDRLKKVNEELLMTLVYISRNLDDPINVDAAYTLAEDMLNKYNRPVIATATYFCSEADKGE